MAYWNQWLEQTQATNDADAHDYSHGVFEHEPTVNRLSRVAEDGGAYEARGTAIAGLSGREARCLDWSTRRGTAIGYRRARVLPHTRRHPGNG